MPANSSVGFDRLHWAADVTMHARQMTALLKTWDDKLFDHVQCHGNGLYTVPSRSKAGEFYAVQYWPLAPDGYVYTCTCKASELGGVVCVHVCAAHLWRLAWRFNWRIKDPTGRGR
jgi:hypothetical protein